MEEFTVGLDPQMKGLAISNSEPIRKAHNSFRQQTSFEIVHDKERVQNVEKRSDTQR